MEFREVGRSAFIGSIATAVVQAVLATIGYVIAGVSEPISWGIMTGIASFIPLVGTALVWAPLSIYLVLDGSIGKAIFLILWGALVVMATVMAAGMVPPLAMALSTAIRPRLYTPAERDNGKAAWLLGLAFISEAR